MDELVTYFVCYCLIAGEISSKVLQILDIMTIYEINLARENNIQFVKLITSNYLILELFRQNFVL